MPAKFRILGFILMALFFAHPLWAQTMKGKVYDRDSKKPLAGVNIINTYTQLVYRTDSTGLFQLQVKPEQIIKFEKHGYQLANVRIEGTHLPYYSIGLHKGAYELPEVKILGHNYQSDSLEAQKTYRWAMTYYKPEGLDIIRHPFDMLSKKNRRIWAFQKRFHYYEQQKFIDYVFNDKLIHEITGLEGAALLAYKKAYRPKYQQIQQWSTYEFYTYIKETGHYFKAQR